MSGTVLYRVAVPEDADGILEIYRPYIEDTTVTFEETVPSPEAFRARVEGILAQYPYLVAEWDGKIVGYAYAAPYRPREGFRWTADFRFTCKRICGATESEPIFTGHCWICCVCRDIVTPFPWFPIPTREVNASMHGLPSVTWEFRSIADLKTGFGATWHCSNALWEIILNSLQSPSPFLNCPKIG